MVNQIFQSNSSKKLPYNNFPIGGELLTSGQMGKLIPVFWSEVYPHDRFKFFENHLIRLAPLSAPTMARFNLHLHAFYVPFRIITERVGNLSTWDKMISSIGNTDTSKIPTLPYLSGNVSAEQLDTLGTNSIKRSHVSVGSLWDYLGLPIPKDKPTGGKGDLNIPDELRLSLLPFLAYQKIYDDFYRRDQIEPPFQWPLSLGKLDAEILDRNLFGSESDYDNPEEGTVQFGQNQSMHGLFELRSRNYERDYFTSCLPEPQFGDDVSIGGDITLTDDASIALLATSPLRGYSVFPQTSSDVSIGANTIVSADVNEQIIRTTLEQYYPDIDVTDDMMKNYRVLGAFQQRNPYPGGYASFFSPILPEGETGLPFTVTEANGFSHGFSINELRLAIQLQGVRELINRGGTRPIEIYESIYQVKVPDLRLQRVQFLGGTKDSITIGSVIQTSASENGSPLGEMAGKGLSSGSSLVFKNKHEFKEHGILMVIMSITPRTGYYGGIPRKFLKRDWFDFYIPQFDHVGEMEVYRSELYYDWQNPNDETPREVFGYQLRNADLKSGYSTVTGEFRRSLDNWHVLREFDNTVGLNLEFIKADSQDFNRIFQFEDVANTSNEQFYAQFVFDVRAKRAMSKYSTPFVLG